MLVTAGQKSASSSYRHGRGIRSFNVAQTARIIKLYDYVGEAGDPIRDRWHRKALRQLQESKGGARVSFAVLGLLMSLMRYYCSVTWSF